MTDNEIIKALECCSNRYDCYTCEYYNQYCKGDMNVTLKDALDLINRLQAKLDEAEDTIQFAYKELKKAEAEVETELDKLNAEKNDVMYHKAQIKAEAVKEFAERLKEKYLDDEKIVNMAWVNAIEHIDNLVKEMEGE